MADGRSSSGPAPAPGDVFVGRRDLFETLVMSPPQDEARIVDLHGIPGSGKTTFLRHVRHRLPEVRPTAVFSIAVSESDGRGAGPADESALALSPAYARFREVLSKLVRDIVKLEEDAGRNVGRAVRNLAEITTALTNAASEAAHLTDDAGPGIMQSQTDLAQIFADCYPLVLGDRPALVVVNNFDHVATGALGPWLLDVVRRLPGTVTVVARTPAAPAVLSPPEAELVERQVPPLTGDDIREMLETCLPGADVTDELVGVVERLSHGNAADVAHAVLRMQQLEGPLEPAVVEARLADPDAVSGAAPGPPAGVRALVPPDLEPVVKGCCVLRSFDAGLLEEFLDRRPGEGADLIAGLQRNLLIEEDEADPRDSRLFRLDALTRERFANEFAKNDLAGWQRANQRAAAQMNAWLAGYEERAGDDQVAYGAWYRYERPDWQAGARDWLHYEARGADTPAARKRSRARFAHHFFDAFFWWGCYVPFPFISDLLDDWERTQDDAEFTSRLRTFVAEYPTGYRKDSRPERWESVFQSLLGVRRLCGLPPSAAKLEGDQRHVGALIQIFLAHTYRYRATADDAERARRYGQAAGYYDAAVDLLRREEGGEWGIAWALFERAELHAEHGGAQAREDWHESARLVPDLGDDELAANLHRLAADVRWPDAPADAFAAHGRAVLHAYFFQARYQSAPDAYTRDFYCEQVDRSVGRLIDHARAGGDVREAVDRLRAPFPWMTAVNAPEVARRCAEDDRPALRSLLPEPPRAEELLHETSAFMEEWGTRIEELGNPDATVEESAW